MTHETVNIQLLIPLASGQEWGKVGNSVEYSLEVSSLMAHYGSSSEQFKPQVRQ